MMRSLLALGFAHLAEVARKAGEAVCERLVDLAQRLDPPPPPQADLKPGEVLIDANDYVAAMGHLAQAREAHRRGDDAEARRHADAYDEIVGRMRFGPAETALRKTETAFGPTP
jgi:hypothetical protein